MNNFPTENGHASAGRPAHSNSSYSNFNSSSRQPARAHLLPAFSPAPSRPSAPPKRRVSLALPNANTPWPLAPAPSSFSPNTRTPPTPQRPSSLAPAPSLLPSAFIADARSPHPPSTPTKRKDDTLRKGYDAPLSPRRAAAPYVPKARAVSGPGGFRPCTPPPLAISNLALGTESPRLARVAKMRIAKAHAASGPGPSRPCTPPPPSASAAMAISPLSLGTESPRLARFSKMKIGLGRSASGPPSRPRTPSSMGLERMPNQPWPCREALDKYRWLESEGSPQKKAAVTRYDCVNLNLLRAGVDSPRTRKMHFFADEPLHSENISMSSPRKNGEDINMSRER